MEEAGNRAWVVSNLSLQDSDDQDYNIYMLFLLLQYFPFPQGILKKTNPPS